MKTIHYILLSVLIPALYACTQPSTLEDELRNAEMSIANGDMQAAASATEHIVGNRNLSDLSARQLARLSIIYMQMADSLDREDSVGQATQCYRQAYEANSDSAITFYSGLNPDKMRYAVMLRALATPRDSSYNSDYEEYPDSIDIPAP